ncbi:MAG: MFS family permease [Bacteroidia bacterium]|jgi:MFS family permease
MRNWVKRYRSILIIVLAGESVFLLPFVLARVFRPTLMEVFQINNFELGTFFSVYGMIAVAAYFFGGPLADRFAASKLMSVALGLTGLGGFYLSTIPSPAEMKWLYGYWGCTTILLFWAAMLRATRKWGGKLDQGKAFGYLDGGRGLTAALIGMVAVSIFSMLLPQEVSEATYEQRVSAFQSVIFGCSTFVILVSFLVRFGIQSDPTELSQTKPSLSFKSVKQVLKLKGVWIQSIIIVCAYSGYKVSDDFTLMAKDLLNYNAVESAMVGSLMLWIRPIAAISAGFLADRFNTTKMITVSFGLMVFGGLMIGTGAADGGVAWMVFLAIISSALGMFAMRGLYFAIMEELKIPFPVTGTAIGVASIIGYTPDIYMGPLMGTLLDNSPGVIGHQHVFLLLAGFASVGLLSVLVLKKVMYDVS